NRSVTAEILQYTPKCSASIFLASYLNASNVNTSANMIAPTMAATVLALRRRSAAASSSFSQTSTSSRDALRPPKLIIPPKPNLACADSSARTEPTPRVSSAWRTLGSRSVGLIGYPSRRIASAGVPHLAKQKANIDDLPDQAPLVWRPCRIARTRQNAGCRWTNSTLYSSLIWITPLKPSVPLPLTSLSL